MGGWLLVLRREPALGPSWERGHIRHNPPPVPHPSPGPSGSGEEATVTGPGVEGTDASCCHRRSRTMRGRERDSELETLMREKHRSAASCTPPTGDVPATKGTDVGFCPHLIQLESHSPLSPASSSLSPPVPSVLPHPASVPQSPQLRLIQPESLNPLNPALRRPGSSGEDATPITLLLLPLSATTAAKFSRLKVQDPGTSMGRSTTQPEAGLMAGKRSCSSGSLSHGHSGSRRSGARSLGLTTGPSIKSPPTHMHLKIA
ncbi:hypothetical protein QTO34_013787 [Cnephaeus nilssonii]|uniref:Uncharacterized protein n=1 Tax=Cnephaeus nilssonii TaxID=3371016 RepID=A0AA40I8N3_CNENI|nr:hypothetical protein QTO34_013787 [Eptesicus nilssonii]